MTALEQLGADTSPAAKAYRDRNFARHAELHDLAACLGCIALLPPRHHDIVDYDRQSTSIAFADQPKVNTDASLDDGPDHLASVAAGRGAGGEVLPHRGLRAWTRSRHGDRTARGRRPCSS